jgi:hypothetical protein
MIGMSGGGSNGQQRPDVDVKGVNDGVAIAMGNCIDSAMDNEMAAMVNGGGVKG